MSAKNPMYVTEMCEPLECANCGTPFSISLQLQKNRRENHQTFHCPNGHHNYYPQESEAERLKRQLAESERRLEFAKNNARTLQQQLDAKDGQLSKLKKRVAKGICPCCKRSFTALQRHIKTKHPDYATS